ncbi:hypothetical protein GGR57DRAFT_513917 [Xylariaceae sp. FL1272]|nr:hypothetical protein GGR57DRAFT_513917 [Xylariaceae sp. FL1272]
MAGPGRTLEGLQCRRFEGRVIIRRFTDQMPGTDELERSTKAAQADAEEEEDLERRRQMRLLYADLEDEAASLRDFGVAEVALEALQKVVDEFYEVGKPSKLQIFGGSHKSANAKAAEVLNNANNLDDIKRSVEDIDKSWKESHGPVYNAFQRLCGTLDDHKSLLAIFPSQNIYTSVLTSSLSCLIKAAKNHTDIAETLAKSMASISDKVATCSGLIVIIRTRRLRKKLAGIYARMFQFYGGAIKWYLQSRLSRVLSSFNENLKKECTDATTDLEACINELYREAFVSSTAMIAMTSNDCSKLRDELKRQRQHYEQIDTLAGRRMLLHMEASWMSITSNGVIAGPNVAHRAVNPLPETKQLCSPGLSRAEARIYSDAIRAVVNGDEGPALLTAGGSSWVAQDGVLPKLRAWMVEDTKPSTLWISSPYETEETTSARAAALAVVASAYQAETPLISHFCQRPRRDERRANMSIEELGLIGAAYSLIHQLLQFGEDSEDLSMSKESLAALDGSSDSWTPCLGIMRELLNRTPALMYCVIDGINDLELKNGSNWCRQFLDVLFERQRKEGTMFNILLTTAGQSRILPSFVQFSDRQISTKRAREVSRFGRRIDL